MNIKHLIEHVLQTVRKLPFRLGDIFYKPHKTVIPMSEHYRYIYPGTVAERVTMRYRSMSK